MGKIELAGHSGRRDEERGRSVATRSTTKKSGNEKPAAKKATPKKAAANGPAASAGAKPATAAKKRLPAATIRALKELDAGEVSHDADEAAPCTRSHIPNARTRKALGDADTGKNLTRYVDADDLFRKLGIKLGQEKA
jgi:hypothetical protein